MAEEIVTTEVKVEPAEQIAPEVQQETPAKVTGVKPTSETIINIPIKEPKRVDWIAAKQFYLDDFRRTYADVAKEFKCSTQVVETNGNKDSWVETRKELGEKAMLEFEANKISQMASMIERHRKAYATLLDIVEVRLKTAENEKPKDLKALADVLEKAVNGERLILGLPTAVSKSEISGKLTTDMQLPQEVVDKMDLFFANEK